MADLEPTTTAEDIEWACARLRSRADALRFPPAMARGLERADSEQMLAAANFLIERGQTEDLRAVVERFRNTKDFGVWAQVISSRLHHLSGDFAAGLADIDELMARFPERAGAHWWIARARCLAGLGRHEEAEAAVREGVERFPDAPVPRVFLANMLSRQKRYRDSLSIWQDLIGRAKSPEPEWFINVSRVLKSLGRREEAFATLEDFVARFPQNPGAEQLVLQIAEDREDWAAVLRLWDERRDKGDEVQQAQTEIGRARALFRLNRPDEAMETLEAVVARRPDSVQAWRELAHIANEIGEASRARDILRNLTGRFANISRPEWWAILARAHHDLREYDAGAAALAELERRFPDSPLGAHEDLRLAKELEHGLDELKARVEAARKRFPEDFNLRSHWIWILLSLGQLEEAERQVEALEAEEAPGFALAARLRLEADRGDEHLRAYVQRFSAEREWSVADAIQVGYALLDTREPWGFAAGAAILEPVALRIPGHAALNHLRIRLMIARREDAAALALIDATPARYQRREILELRSWAAAKREQHEEAKTIWRHTIATNYYAALHSPIHKLERASGENRPGPDVGVTAYVVMRNEAAQIPAFLAHHRRLGVKRFVFFDHLSTDGGRDLALAEPDVIVYDCPESYQLSWSGRRWVNEIVAREGARGWGLQLDMDEHLIYPGSETVSIDRFVAYLDACGFEGVRGYMLDVFPRRLLDAAGEPAAREAYRWYDDDYYLFGLERPPYLHPGGGVRARLFAAKEYLHKVPIWRLGAGLLINSHETTHLRFADVSAALLHYKMMNVAIRGGGQVEQTGTAFLEADAAIEAIRRHARYAARLDKLWRADLVKPGVSRELEGSLALTRRGLMEASEPYRAWMKLEAGGPPGTGASPNR